MGSKHVSIAFLLSAIIAVCYSFVRPDDDLVKKNNAAA